MDQSANRICNAIDTSGETSATDDQNATNESRRSTQVRYPDDIKRWLVAQRRRNDSRVVSTAAAKDGKVLILDSKSTGEWMIRVPKTRQAVMPDERLWTIPENWEKRLTVDSPHRPEEILYSIPESGVFVVVESLAQKLSRKAGYRVTSVGDLDITCRPPNYDRLETALGKYGVDIDTVVRDSLPPWLVKKRFSKLLTPRYGSRSRK